MTREEKQKAIDAVEKLNALKQFIGYDKDSEIVKATQKSLDMAIKALDKEPKKGHWCRKTKVDAYDIAGVKTWGIKCQCDRCDFTTIVVEDFGYYNYCPNCGAKMESEDKE